MKLNTGMIQGLRPTREPWLQKKLSALHKEFVKSCHWHTSMNILRSESSNEKNDDSHSTKDPPSSSTDGWLSARKGRRWSHPEFKPTKSRKVYKHRTCYPGDKIKLGRKCPLYQSSITLHKEKRYPCKDCEKWFESDHTYVNKDIQLQRCCKHKKPPRPESPDSDMWNISFPDSDN